MDSADRDKISPLIEAFREYSEGKESINVMRYKCHRFNQTTQNMETYIRALHANVAQCECEQLERSLLWGGT